MTERIDLTELEALDQEALPRWRWGGYTWDLMLMSMSSMRPYVMGFVRHRMQGAQPTFGDRTDEGYTVLRKATEMAVKEVPYRDDVVDIDNPNARIMVAARNALPALIAAARVLEEIASEECTYPDCPAPVVPMNISEPRLFDPECPGEVCTARKALVPFGDYAPVELEGARS